MSIPAKTMQVKLLEQKLIRREHHTHTVEGAKACILRALRDKAASLTGNHSAWQVGYLIVAKDIENGRINIAIND